MKVLHPVRDAMPAWQRPSFSNRGSDTTPDEKEGGAMATTAVTRTHATSQEGALRLGTWLMGAAASVFIGYAVLFQVRNFTDSFLELGIGPNEVDVGKDQ